MANDREREKGRVTGRRAEKKQNGEGLRRRRMGWRGQGLERWEEENMNGGRR
jgi:hypothetical protein